MVAIRGQAQQFARQAWTTAGPNDLDSYQPAILALQVAELQRSAARLGTAYVAAFVASEMGAPVRVPAATAFQVGTAYSGSDLARALLGPMLGVKVDIREGKDRSVAFKEGQLRLEAVAGLATDAAAREAQRVAMELNPYVEAWRRAIKGTCDACLAATAEGTYAAPGTPLEIHPNCQCVAEPVVNRNGTVLKPSEPGGRPEGAILNELKQVGELDKIALRGYVNTEHWAVNEYLRYGRVNPEYLTYSVPAQKFTEKLLQGRIKFLDDILDHVQPLESPKTVFRGTDNYKDLKVGKVIRDKGYVSTSTKPSVEQFGRDRVILELPTGTRALDINLADDELRLDALRGEREWLLPRDSKFVVTKIEYLDQQGNNYRLLKTGEYQNTKTREKFAPVSVVIHRIVHARLKI